LDQEEAWRLTKLVFWGILIFTVLRIMLVSLLIKLEPQALELKIIPWAVRIGRQLAIWGMGRVKRPIQLPPVLPETACPLL
jgi:hypothetical protein